MTFHHGGSGPIINWWGEDSGMKTIKATITIEEFDGRRASPDLRAMFEHWCDKIRRTPPGEPPEPFDLMLRQCFVQDIHHQDDPENPGRHRVSLTCVVQDVLDDTL